MKIPRLSLNKTYLAYRSNIPLIAEPNKYPIPLTTRTIDVELILVKILLDNVGKTIPNIDKSNPCIQKFRLVYK